MVGWSNFQSSVCVQRFNGLCRSFPSFHFHRFCRFNGFCQWFQWFLSLVSIVFYFGFNRLWTLVSIVSSVRDAQNSILRERAVETRLEERGLIFGTVRKNAYTANKFLLYERKWIINLHFWGKIWVKLLENCENKMR